MTGRRVVGAFVLIAALAALFVMLSRRRAPSAVTRSGEGEAETGTWRDEYGSSSLTTAPSGTREHPMVPPPPATIEQPRAPRGRPPYSPDTFRLAAEIKPGASEWDETPSDPNGTLVLRVRPTAYVVRAPAPIAVELEVVDGKKRRQPIARAELQLRGRGEGAAVHTMAFVDDGTGADRAAGDALYTATFAPDESERPRLYGHVQGQAQVQLTDGKVYLLSTTVVYSVEPGARIAGEYADSVRDGDLYIGMALAVDHGGLYQVRGELFGPSGEPIAETRLVRALDAGRPRVELHFFGKALFDAGVNGPYLLRDLYVSEHLAGADYDAMGPVVDDAWRTQPYRAVDFTRDEYQPPATTAPVVTATSPSQATKPPPLFGARPTGPTTALSATPQPTVSVAPDRAP